MTRVLIVDDKEENVYYLQALLVGNGCKVESARHGAEALVKARQAPPDVVISDLLMPVMDGYTLLRHWKADARLKRIPFIVYTATYTEAEDERLALNLGADAFILKPADPEDFLARLREVQANFGAAVPVAPKTPIGEENETFKIYSETLIRKLEEKTLQLEETNCVLMRDVEDRKRAEDTLRLLNSAVLQANESIMITDAEINSPGPRIIFVNPAFTRMTGYTAEEVIGKTPRILQGHRTDRAVLDRLRKNLEHGKMFQGETVNYRKDGTAYDQEWRIAPIREANGEITHFVAIQSDVTDRKQATAQIQEQAALLNQTQEAIIVRDLAQRILFWNKGAERIYGWTAAEMVGRHVNELLYRESGPLAGAMETLMRQGEWAGELMQFTKAGAELCMECRWTLLREKSGAPKSVLAVNTDVTERKKIERQFLRAQRLESIGTLAGGIAHDLNNLLAPIVMGVDLLKQFDATPRTLTIIENIERSAKRGTDLVRQVLSFARGVEGTRVALQVRTVVREVESIAENTFPKNIIIRTEIPPDLWLVMADSTQLNQVLINLCVNARDAMSEGGHLSITASNVEVDAQYAVMNRGASAGKYVVLQVSDSGCGMPKEIVDRIFEPFFTTKELGKGTGLGLSTVLGIVRSHSGFVNVYSETGRGSVFKVYLPAHADDTSNAERDPEAGTLPRGNGELIMVVDDETSILDITKQTLETFGYKVVTAEDGAQAIGLYAFHREEIAVVLTDMMMPVMDGPALIAALMRINPVVRVVAASGLNANGNAVRAATGGVKHFLAKPYSAEAMLRMLKTVLVD